MMKKASKVMDESKQSSGHDEIDGKLLTGIKTFYSILLYSGLGFSSRAKDKKSFVIGITISVILWSGTSLFCLFYFYVDGSLQGVTFFAAPHIWYFGSAVIQTTLLINLNNSSVVSDFLRKWNKATEDPETFCSLKRMSKRCVYAWVVFEVTILPGLIYVVYFSPAKIIFDDAITTKMNTTDWVVEVLKSFIFLTDIATCFVWVNGGIIIVLFASAVRKIFSTINRDITKAFPTKGIKAQHAPVEFYDRHELACDLLLVTDKMFRGLTGMLLLMDCSIFVLVLYNTIWDDSGESGFTTVLLQFMVSTGTVLVILCTLGGCINHSAHWIRHVLHRIDLSTHTQAELTQHLALVSRVEGRDIGLTAFGVFTIHRGTGVTVLAALVTYFTLVVSFSKMMKPAAPPECTLAFANGNYTCFSA